MKEHNADMRMGRVEKSAIAEHIHATGHKVHWGARVIEKEQHGGRRVKEAIHIHRMRKRGGSMNQDSGWRLSKIWLDLIQSEHLLHLTVHRFHLTFQKNGHLVLRHEI